MKDEDVFDPRRLVLLPLAQRTNDLDLTVVQSNGTTPLDLTGKTLAFTVKLTKVSAALFTKTIGDGIAVVNAAGGVFRVTIDPADTSGLAEEVYYHETEVTNGAEVVTIMDGRLKIKKSLFSA